MNKLLFIILLSDIFCVYAQHWGYPKENPNGVVTVNENWGGECDTGQRQSPVDLNYNAAVKGHFPLFIFSNYDKRIKDGAVKNTGHSIQIDNPMPPTEFNTPTIIGGGLPGKYIFDQMHFHWGSEHTINNERFGLELHMVHHEEKYESLSAAVTHKRGIAVLGILFHLSVEPNPIIETIINSSETIKDNTKKKEELIHPIALIDLLPNNRSTYFRYEGSLTTPNCGEAVMWTVFTNSLSISTDQVDKLKTMIQTKNGTLTHNFRTVQPLNSRTLVYVTHVSPENHDKKAKFDNGAPSFSNFSGLFLLFYILNSIFSFLT